MSLKEDDILEVLFRNRLKLAAYARSIVRDFHVAEDVFQNVSIKAIRSAEKFNDTQHLLKWIWTVCRTESIQMLKISQKQPYVFDEHVLEAVERELQRSGQLDSSGIYSILEECMEKLSSYSRQLIIQRYRMNLTGEKLAKAVNKKVSTVYVALSRVHRKLQECMINQMRYKRD